MSAYPFKNILLATEHTEFDVGAERLALVMAQHCNLPLRAVLPILSNPEYEVEAPQLALRAERDAAVKINKLRSQAQEAGVILEIGARRGPEPYREIVEEATLHGCDLIVARRRGKQGFLARLLVGEMVSKVAGHAPCSVLFVPRAAHMWTRGVLAAVDGSAVTWRVAEMAAMVAAQCALPLTIVSVANHDTPNLRAEAEKTLAQTLATASTIGAKGQGQVLVGKPFEQIVNAAKTFHADLIVIGRHGESNVFHSPLGGTAQKIVGLSDNPVLVVHE